MDHPAIHPFIQAAFVLRAPWPLAASSWASTSKTSTSIAFSKIGDSPSKYDCHHGEDDVTPRHLKSGCGHQDPLGFELFLLLLLFFLQGLAGFLKEWVPISKMIIQKDVICLGHEHANPGTPIRKSHEAARLNQEWLATQLVYVNKIVQTVGLTGPRIMVFTYILLGTCSFFCFSSSISAMIAALSSLLSSWSSRKAILWPGNAG
jgi:hypothetical protein